MLDVRLEELSDYVDYFVLVEANYTHSGNKKPYIYEQNKSRYDKYNDRIIHIKVDREAITPTATISGIRAAAQKQ